jgi:hypothetical protein
MTTLKVKVKGKVEPRTGHEGPGRKYRYSSTLSVTSALDGSGQSTPRPDRFARGERPCAIWVRGCMHPTAGLDGCGKSRLHGDSFPGPYSP